ncbi:chromosome segregation SMC family protein [Paracoccus sp. p4-l81]|uniref:chromosome segregation SMC family protein n=1 Tax=unclassified Paracoccus (in: a-proteobacteria) TaxID=2688777 RepID=UPI0035B91518
MRINRLRLNGFKSFVDPTDLVIREGLTGVVGPNGCGKSNLLEALRWVMGESRPTAMRGSGMEDVIFAGAATRPARHTAEVTMFIDNADRLAPAGFNDSDTLEILRKITREAGSAYKVNGKDVRARDVQMLFADASTGAHSPALVRQGQISELINAKPQNRRRILEEAAGISGLYQRRHEAELKLSGAEQNLARVDDVIDQLASQLQTLARQARQAARYREIGEDLRRFEALLALRRWMDADAARAEAEAALADRTRAAAQAESAARQAARAREEAEGALPPLREEEAIAGAILQRLGVARETLEADATRAVEAIRTLAARVDQLGRDIDRETGLTRDAGEVIARLEWEQGQLEKAGLGHDDRLSAAQEAATEAGAALSEAEEVLSALTEDAARLSARYQSAERLRGDQQKLLDRAEADRARAAEAVAAQETAVAAARAALADAEAAEVEAQDQADAADEALTAAEARRADLQARESAARATRAEAEGEAGALRAEVDALARLVARESMAGRQLLDSLTVDRGYEAALGAALADDLRQPEVAGNGGGSGWALLPGYDDPLPLPPGVVALSDHVRAHPLLARRLSQIGLVADPAEGAARQAELRPGQRLVTQGGDLWRWDGLRAASGDVPSAAALRLTQLNRLVELKRDLEDVAARAAGAAAAHDALHRDLAEAGRDDQAAREARRAADRNLAEAQRAASRAGSEAEQAASRLETARLAVQRHDADAMSSRQGLREAEAALSDLPDLDALRGRVEDGKQAVEGARIAMMSRRAAADEIRRDGDARTRRRQEVVKELSGWRHRLDTAGTRVAELEARKADTEDALAEARDKPAEHDIQREELARQIATAEARRATAADALAAAETALRRAAEAEREAERAAGATREDRARAEARADATREALAAALHRMDEDLEATPEALIAQLDLPRDGLAGAVAPADALDIDVQRLRRQRESLGAVNLRAEEDAREVQEEHDRLATDKADLEEAIRKLRAGIAGLNREGRERLLTAFEQVNENFRFLFTHLFGGGEARLVLVESDDPLEAGLEIMCQPPGKKLSTLSLLSGGEQTLTALALIFGVFLTNPAPICVLDEVDAPLDDANVTRFCDLLDEMTRRTDTRFLIITHHAVTMARMDRLFGVTMAEQGVSQLVSVDLKKAEALVA